jgi:hypothetical protein
MREDVQIMFRYPMGGIQRIFRCSESDIQIMFTINYD